MIHVDFPWSFDPRGRTARTGHAGHVRDLVELLVLTHLGERVNRPGFGCGLHQLVFSPNSPELADALTFVVKAALHRELGDLLTLDDLTVVVEQSTLRVELAYVLRAGALREELTVELGDVP
jgi:phage baseplate assembly protein W